MLAQPAPTRRARMRRQIRRAGYPSADSGTVLQHEDDRQYRQHQRDDLQHKGVDPARDAEPPGAFGDGEAKNAPAGKALDPDVEVIAGLLAGRDEADVVVGRDVVAGLVGAEKGGKKRDERC